MKKNCLLALLLALLCTATTICNAQQTSQAEDKPHYYPVRERLLTHSLNGTWKFKLVKGLDVPSDCNGWETAAFDDRKWDQIIVPGNWETQGLKTPEYGRDLEEYIGLYRTSFKYDAAWKHKHVIIRFDGVLFGFEFYLNGNKVGSFGSAFNLSQFDLTPYLRTDGDNILCVKVSTRSMGWLFDTNDCWSLCGITRSVDLFAIDNTYLEDVTFRTDVDSTLDATVKLDIDINQFKADGKAYQIRAALSDALNHHVLNFSQAIDDPQKTYHFEGNISQPQLWTAETPNLYRLEVCIVNDKGAMVQRINEKVGIRSIAIEGFDMKINHRPVFLRGACMNEIDPKNGRAFTIDDFRRQLQMMKSAHINFIRTAHYPFSIDFLNICDELGFYVCDEVPFGSRGAANLKDEAYLPELMRRADATVRRDKNHPAVILWSLGNENPYTSLVEEVLKFVKAKDPSRPRGLPQKVGDFGSFAKKPSENVDVILGHYLNDTRINQAIETTKLPIIHTEYSHALGTAFGDFEKRFDRMMQDKEVIGGSLWCWSDQTVMTYGDNQQNPVLKSVWVDSLRFMDSYGRSDAPEGKMEIWKEATDGVVYGDGYPQEDYFMVRKVYSPVVVLTEALKGQAGKSNQFELDIENRFDFKSLHGYKLNYHIQNLQQSLSRGEVWLHAASRSQEKIAIEATLPATLLYQDLMLCIEVADPNGKIINEKNIDILLDEDRDYLALIHEMPVLKAAKSAASKTAITETIKEYGKISVTDKGLVSITDATGKTVLQSPLYLRVGRPLTTTLAYLAQKDTFYWDPYILKGQVESFETAKIQDGVKAELSCRWIRQEKPEEYVLGVITISLSENGTLQLDYQLTPSENASGYFLECGLTFKLDPSFDALRWIGDGPYNTTPGKTAFNERSIWTLHKNDIRFIGNKGNVNLAVITRQDTGLGLWSNTGNIAVENINDTIYVSQNIVVTGYGSKFTSPQGKVSLEKVNELKGSWILFLDEPSHSPVFMNALFKSEASYPTVVPEQPYLKSYGW